MSRLSNEQFSALRQHAEVIEADHHGEKVLKLVDGSFLKLFRRKRLISSATLVSHAKRFADNAAELKRRDILCPEIIATYRIRGIERTAVHYWPLPGKTLRQLLVQPSDEHTQLCRDLGALIAELHDKGVYFRSLHLGNVVQDEASRLGLIDISDMACGEAALGRLKRSRNFQHLFRYPQDVDKLQANREAFIDGYVEDLTPADASHFRKHLRSLFDQQAATSSKA
ncbi:toluene tolerance protein [Pseudomonas daroniae]|uniref:Toluene tolerance protein n=1 Tax=Phytopseudomonas daroniae TaxID=2487519 RepID=A0A4Q9QRZ1_9GAMM|nr:MULTISPECIES: lipopolysaccharide kinase InaA family protein [Pseudomonas]TBU83018.1 toluene tolerance protein [Pseudomonas sp. FRB 228]TBU83969.1 toluene tolerance protein [Pseudomonas daroniae]TBU93147.1 toluene tolerance protein [Pseudomonas daroniae]